MLMVGITTAGMAQQQYSLDHFVGLKAEGTIPADLRKNLAEIYSEDKQRVRDYNDGKLTNRDRVLEVSYHISRLMNNGRILYGDPITRMVERIADTLLKDYPQLRSELRFYTVKSPAVNAFATGQGMIFVTTGLVAQAENESQLAYIISHEVIHYFRKHNMEMITRRVKNTDDEAGQMADFLLFHNRSREMEGEADSLGLTMFYLNSPYDKQVTEGVFDVLQYALLPFDEVPFDTLYFNSPYYKIPNHYYLAKVADITSRDDYDDSRSTHPNIKKRRAHTGEIISHQQGGSKYVVTTMQEFAHLRMLARFECIRQNLIYSNYTRAFYDSYVLSKQLPDNPFLRRSMVQALYGIAMVKTYRNTNEIVGDYHQQEGEIQQLYYLFGKLNSEEACLLAMREIWKYHLQFPNDPQAMAMGRDMMLTLRDRHHLSRNAFADTYTSAPSPGAVEKEQPDVNQKYARIRQKKQKSEAQNPTRFAFTDFMMQNGDFRKFMDDCLDAPQPQKPQPSAQLSTLLYAPQYLVVENKTDNPDVKYRHAHPRRCRFLQRFRHHQRVDQRILAESGLSAHDAHFATSHGRTQPTLWHRQALPQHRGKQRVQPIPSQSTLDYYQRAPVAYIPPVVLPYFFQPREHRHTQPAHRHPPRQRALRPDPLPRLCRQPQLGVQRYLHHPQPCPFAQACARLLGTPTGCECQLRHESSYHESDLRPSGCQLQLPSRCQLRVGHLLPQLRCALSRLQPHNLL